MTRETLLVIGFTFSALAVAGCQERLQYQPKLKTFGSTSFYRDHAAARPLPSGTIPFHQERATPPTEASMSLLQKGKQKYEIFCSVCHGLDGRGQGMAVQRGFPQAPSFLEATVKKMSLGEIVEIENNGHDEMKGFADRLDNQEQWAVALYVRALQVSESR